MYKCTDKDALTDVAKHTDECQTLQAECQTLKLWIQIKRRNKLRYRSDLERTLCVETRDIQMLCRQSERISMSDDRSSLVDILPQQITAHNT